MKAFLTIFLFLFFWPVSFGQNQNLSDGNVFDGEPCLAIDPASPQHMVVAWMGYQPLYHIMIKTRVTFDGGQTWAEKNFIPHTNPAYGSADPSLAFDNNGNVFLCYVDYDTGIDSGSVYIRKSTDGGLHWEDPVEVINAHSDEGKYPIDRPWISVDRSGGNTDGNIYVTSMPPNVFGPLPPPYHPYFMASGDGGSSFGPWRYLDTINWLSGNLIQQPMATHCVSKDGTFHAVYPSYLFSQNVFAQFLLASTKDGGVHFSYHTVFASPTSVDDTLAKKGYLLRADPSRADHLAFFYLDVTYGDIDVFMRESYDEGISWSGPVRINDDPVSNNRMQDMLWADFDEDGDLVVTWRDRRNSPDSTYETTSEIWGAVRWKDSTGFSPNFRISDISVPYDQILSGSGNDFMCVRFANDTINAVWGDTRTGKLNIWFARISAKGTPVSIHNLSTESKTSVFLYPNPFRSNLTISGTNLDQVDIYDQTGKFLLHFSSPTRDKQFSIDLGFLKKGIYLFRIRTNEGDIITKTAVKT